MFIHFLRRIVNKLLSNYYRNNFKAAISRNFRNACLYIVVNANQTLTHISLDFGNRAVRIRIGDEWDMTHEQSNEIKNCMASY